MALGNKSLFVTHNSMQVGMRGQLRGGRKDCDPCSQGSRPSFWWDPSPLGPCYFSLCRWRFNGTGLKMVITLAHNSLSRIDFSVPKKKRNTWILLITRNLSQIRNDLTSMSQDKMEGFCLVYV